LHRGLHREGVGSDCVHAVYGNVGSHATLSLSRLSRRVLLVCTQAALRELKEECGYVGTTSSKSPALCLSPGLSNETAAFVRIDIDLDGACARVVLWLLSCGIEVAVMWQ
jgi:hypothetical protein